MAAKETIKAQAKEITAPHKGAGTTPHISKSRMGYSSTGRSDPLTEKVEAEELKGGVAIDNTGRGLLRIRNPLFEINDKYETAAEKEAAERLENGGMTEAEEHQAEFYREIAAEDYYDSLEEQREAYFRRTYSEDSLYEMGASQRGEDGKDYVAIHDKESGELMYYDDGNSCIAPNATVLGNTVNNDLIDADQRHNINYKVDADGTVTERTAEEKQFQTTLTRMDNDATKLPLQMNMIDRIIEDVSRQTLAANDANFSSAAPSPISTPINASAAFNASAAPAAAEPAPTTPAPDGPAANDPAYRANGTSGPSAAL